MKKIGIVALILLVVFIVFAALSGMVFSRVGSDTFENWQWTTANKEENRVEVNQTAVLDSEGLDKISVSAVSSEVELYTVSGDDIKVELSGISYSTLDPVKLKTEVIGDTVYISVEYPNSTRFRNFFTDFRENGFDGMASFRFENGMLTVGIPESYGEDIKINTVSGDVVDNGHKHDVDKLSIDTVSGGANIKSFDCESMDLDTVSGDFNIVVDSINGSFNSVSGELELYGDSFTEDYTIDTVSGDANIMVEEELSVDVDFDSVSGDFESDLSMQYRSSDGNDIKVTIGDGDGELVADTVSGDVTLN